MNRANLGLSLKSHNFRETQDDYMGQKTFRCTKCGFIASGIDKIPTVYITAIYLKAEILSCDEMMIKDIIE